MSRKNTVIVSILVGVFVITGSLVVLAQVAGEDVGRNILRMARQKNAGETVTKADETTAPPQAATAAEPKAVEPVRPAAPAVKAVAEAAAVVRDEVLLLLPADCLACVRINKLDTSLGAADLYISGVSPIPVSLAMLAKMQIGNLLSDPTLAGVDTQGDFVIFATPLPADPDVPAFMPQIGLGMLVPVSGPEFFQRYTDSQLPGSKYALIGLEPTMVQSLAAVKQQMATSALARGMAADVVRQSKESPMWAYANIAAAVKAFGPILFAQLDQVTALPDMPNAEANAKMAAAGIDFVKTYLTQLDSLSLVLDPRPDTLNAALTLRATPNSDLANLLVRDPAMKSGYSMAGFLNEPAAVNVLAKVNRPLFAKLNASIIALLGQAMTEAMPAETAAKLQSLMASSLDVMGDELAYSFSAAPGVPPMALKQIARVTDNAKAMALVNEGMAVANEMYKAMGLEASIAVEAAETYRQSQVHSIKLDMQLPPEASDAEREQFEQMMGAGFNYRLAVAPGYMLVAAGPEVDADIRELIDQAAAGGGTAAADVQTVLRMVPGAADTDFVASVNVPRLLSGMGGMMKAASIPNAEAMGQMFSSINVPTQSCIGVAGTVADGRGTLQIVVPKQHLLEIVMTAAAMQQSMMQMPEQDASEPDSF